jgi:hypothetical protein
MWHRPLLALILSLAGSAAWGADPVETQKLMLSGEGPADAVPWDFRIDGGMKAGEKTRIAVPSNWQQQGYGHYQYGYDKGPRSDGDHGLYSRHVLIPAGWKDRTIRIVFDAVMTDTLVKVNGVVAGPVHQGGFNRFSYDVTKLVTPGADALIEVAVSEVSAAKDTEIAERHGDYWVFGGIYRPVWLEAAPAQSMASVAIDARADGTIAADVTLAAPRTVSRVVGQVVSLDGKSVGAPFAAAIPPGGTGRLRIAGRVDKPKLWTAETPNRYALDLTLYDGETAVHHLRQRFGFRTFEVRGDGLFLNGQRILLKGADRHSFRPDTGRALKPADAYADVRELKALNMNAVRMSHYSPEESFLEAADELGLYVLDELSGWQHAHDTEVGRKLVRELVERDVNHPSILLWDNGNEGGWNRELDGDFALYDPQHRAVLHPWEPHDGIDTKHYPRYPDLLKRLAGAPLVMPTEFLHGLYDGGGGAGLDDYWRAISTSPKGAGGFLWNFADEGIARTDQCGRIDVAATLAPDGIVGPRHEWEPSAYTVKDIWSPVQITAPAIGRNYDGGLVVINHHDFTDLDQVSFDWSWMRFADGADRNTRPRIVAAGTLARQAVAPHATGTLHVPLIAGWAAADALSLTARRGTDVLWQWTWPVSKPAAAEVAVHGAVPHVVQVGGTIRLEAGSVSARFDAASGLLTGLSRGGRTIALGNGPRLVAMTAEQPGATPVWTAASKATNGVFTLPAPIFAYQAEVDFGLKTEDSWGGFIMEVSADGHDWHRVYNGERTERDGKLYPFPAQAVSMIRFSGVHAKRNPLQVVSVRLAAGLARFPQPVGTVSVTSGQETGAAPVAWVAARGAGGLDEARWTMRADGTLTLDYAYALNGRYLYHGIGFDQPPAGVQTVRALVQGPSPVWKNRTRGTTLGVYDLASSAPGAAIRPGSAGYFAGLRWARFDTAAGPWTVETDDADTFLQLGQRLADTPATSPAFPASDIGLLRAIPAMGAKSQPADTTGPAGQPTDVHGRITGRLVFELR